MLGVSNFIFGMSSDSIATLVIGVIFMLGGAALLYSTMIRNTVATNSYDEAVVRLKRIDDEVYELKRELDEHQTDTLRADTKMTSNALIGNEQVAKSDDDISKTNQLELELRKAKQMLDEGLLDEEGFQLLRKKAFGEIMSMPRVLQAVLP